VPHDLDVEGRGRAEVEDALHDAADEEVDLRARHGVAQLRAHAIGGLNVRQVALGPRHEVDLDVARVRARVLREHARAPEGQADVGDHRREGAPPPIELLADGVLDAPRHLLGALDARADGRLEVDRELGLIGVGEELRPDRALEQQRTPNARDQAHGDRAVDSTQPRARTRCRAPQGLVMAAPRPLWPWLRPSRVAGTEAA
jgi:hypothetical protein